MCTASLFQLMAAKRKRGPGLRRDGDEASKKRRLGERPDALQGGQINHPTLRLYYAQVQTLRSFLLSRLPKTSKKKRRHIQDLGQRPRNTATKQQTQINNSNLAGTTERPPPSAKASQKPDISSTFLDETLVCCRSPDIPQEDPEHAKDFEAFSQHINLTNRSSLGQGSISQSEVS